MTKTVHKSNDLAPPVGPFSQAVEYGGTIFFSGQVAQDSETGALIDGDIIAQTEKVFANIAAVLAACDKTFDDVLRAGVYLIDISDFAAVNAVYAKYFQEPFPARTAIAVSALPLGAQVEIDVVVKA